MKHPMGSISSAICSPIMASLATFEWLKGDRPAAAFYALLVVLYTFFSIDLAYSARKNANLAKKIVEGPL